MRPQTKSNAPLAVEQVATTELPFKRAQVVMAIVVIGLLVGVFVLSPPITEPEADRPLALEATNAQPDNLAEHRPPLSSGHFGQFASRNLTFTGELPDQIQDRQALTEYQWRLGDSDFSRSGSRKPADIVELPNQVPDRGALAEYQSRLSDLGPPTTTAVKANKALIQRAYDEVLNNPNLVVTEACPPPIIYGRCAILNEAALAVVDELFAPNFQHDQAGLPVFSSGSQAVRLHLSVYRLAFPDLHYAVDALVVEGDQVVARWQARGTHSGQFGLHTPTGEPMAWRGTTIWRIADGQIVKARTIQQGPTRQATRAEF